MSIFVDHFFWIFYMVFRRNKMQAVQLLRDSPLHQLLNISTSKKNDFFFVLFLQYVNFLINTQTQYFCKTFLTNILFFFCVLYSGSILLSICLFIHSFICL